MGVGGSPSISHLGALLTQQEQVIFALQVCFSIHKIPRRCLCILCFFLNIRFVQVKFMLLKLHPF